MIILDERFPLSEEQTVVSPGFSRWAAPCSCWMQSVNSAKCCSFTTYFGFEMAVFSAKPKANFLLFCFNPLLHLMVTTNCWNDSVNCFVHTHTGAERFQPVTWQNYSQSEVRQRCSEDDESIPLRSELWRWNMIPDMLVNTKRHNSRADTETRHRYTISRTQMHTKPQPEQLYLHSCRLLCARNVTAAGMWAPPQNIGAGVSLSACGFKGQT